jgi:hypothetical protein
MTKLFCIGRFAHVGALAAIIMFAAGSTAALASGESRDENSPVAEATITNMQEGDSLLVHTQSPTQNTVCADSHGTTDVVVKYDDNETNISPGHCALLEAGHISARAGGEGTTHVTVHGGGNAGGGGHEGKGE